MAASYRNPRNVCRDLTTLIKKTPGATLNIPIQVCRVQIKVRKPVRCLEVWWPMITLADWCQYFMANKPRYLLAGYALDESQAWQGTFRKFWRTYQQLNPDHPLFSTDFSWGHCVPIMIHGDEGRGQLKRPYLVASWQCVISHLGPEVTNDTTHLDQKH